MFEKLFEWMVRQALAGTGLDIALIVAVALALIFGLSAVLYSWSF